MKKIIFTITTITFLFTSCVDIHQHRRIRPSGDYITQDYTFSKAITGLDLSDAITVRISQGEYEKIEVNIDDNVLPFLKVHQSSNGTVSIYFEAVSFIGRKPEFSISVTAKELKKIDLSGASVAYFENNDNSQQPLVFDNLKIDLSGASTLRGHFEANSISASLSGASRMDLSGQCTTFNLSLSGASRAFGYNMICDFLNADFSGASKGECTVLQKLSVSLSGASTLRYDGFPQIIFEKITGSSTLQRR